MGVEGVHHRRNDGEVGILPMAGKILSHWAAKAGHSAEAVPAKWPVAPEAVPRVAECRLNHQNHRHRPLHHCLVADLQA